METLNTTTAKTKEQSHFTWRAVLVGLLIGSLLCFSNMYFGLQTGWISMMSLQSSLVGYAVFKGLEPLLSKTFSIQENVLLQTVAVATATMPLAGGYVGVLPAFGMLTDEERKGKDILGNMGFYNLMIWGFGLTLFGVFFAIPLRKQSIIKEKLKFPSGTATAQMISVLHKDKEMAERIAIIQQEAHSGQRPTRQDLTTLAPGTSTAKNGRELDIADLPSENSDQNKVSSLAENWQRKIKLLLLSFSISAVYTIIAHIYPPLKSIPIFGSYLSSTWLWNLTPSPSFAGQGVIMGLPTTVSMLSGAIVGWGILSPIAKTFGWAPGPVDDWATGSRGWILWISLAIMIGESFTSLIIMVSEEVFAVIKKYLTYSGLNETTQLLESGDRGESSGAGYSSIDTNADARKALEDDAPKDHLVSMRVAWVGLGISTLLCAFAMEYLFSITLKTTVVGVLIACILAVLSVRALGKTDLNPVSGISKIAQIAFAALTPNNILANLVGGAISEAGAMQTGDLMQDLKTGHLLAASPKAQFYAQIIGSVVSVVISSWAFILYNSLYKIPGNEFPAPTAQVWIDMARLVNGHDLPKNVYPASVFFGVLFSAFIIVEKITHFLSPGSRLFLPNGIAFAIGIYNTPNFTLARFIGALVSEYYISWYGSSSAQKSDRSTDAIVVASGFVLGEGTLAFLILIYNSLNK